jgi:hypothetical protein
VLLEGHAELVQTDGRLLRTAAYATQRGRAAISASTASGSRR